MARRLNYRIATRFIVPCVLAWIGSSTCQFCGSVPTCAAQQPEQETSAPGIDYTIIVTGAELLTGVYADGHTQFITRSLLPLGLHCVGSISVDDRKADIERALQYAAPQSKLIIITGGLGPTDNDITREVLSKFTGIALREHPQVLALMERRFGTSAEQLRDNLRRQARVPVQGTYLDNATGTAAGLVFAWGDQVIVALPGPPRELQPMVEGPLKAYLARNFGTHANGCAVTVRFVGLGQSQIDQTLHDHVRMPDNITLATQFSDGRVDFTFSLPQDTPASRQQLERLKQDLQAHLGDYIYATDASTSLEQCVVDLLAKRHETLTLAEAGSGGSITAAVSSGGPQTPAVLVAAYVAPTSRQLLAMFQDPHDSPLDGNPETTAQRLAELAALRGGGSRSIAVGVRQQQSGDSYVIVAFREPGGRIDAIRLPLRDDSRSSRSRLTTMVLDQLRRRMR